MSTLSSFVPRIAPLALASGLTRARAPVLVVVQAGLDDADAIADVHAACFSDSEGRGWSTHEIEDLLRDDTVSIWIARREGRPREHPRGFVILRRVGTLEAEIVSVGAHPDHRREGAGGLLMRHAVRECQHDRIPELFLEVDETNRAATALYERMGFRTVGRREAYYADRTAALTMRLDLRRA